MIGNIFQFDQTTDYYCTVDVYQFWCEDPNGQVSTVTYSPLEGGFSSDYTGTHCQKFDTSGLASRTVEASLAQFTEDDDGPYTLRINAWMYINTDL